MFSNHCAGRLCKGLLGFFQSSGKMPASILAATSLMAALAIFLADSGLHPIFSLKDRFLAYTELVFDV